MSNSEIMKTFSSNLQRLIAEREITVQDLADRCGILRPNLSRIVNGRQNVTLETAGKIADALGVELVDLLSEPALAG